MQTPLILSIGTSQALISQLHKALPHCYFVHHSCESTALEDIMIQPPHTILFSPRCDSRGENRYLFLTRLDNLGFAAKTPCIVLSGASSLEDKRNAFNAGATDYLVQPITNSELAVRVSAVLATRDCRQSLLHLSESLAQSKSVFLKSLATLMAMKDVETGGHLLRVARYTKVLLEHPAVQRYFPGSLSGQARKELSKAAILHDIGKIHIPDSILQKPGPLTCAEFEIIKTHTLYGGELFHSLRQISDSIFLKFAEEIAGAHHEYWNGTGYPRNLQAEEIPCAARIMAVADVYDATRTTRVYKSAWSHALSIQYIMDNKGILFDPVIANCFYSRKDVFNNISGRFKKFPFTPSFSI